jgi:hypothetical protein
MNLWKWQKGRQENCEYQKFPLWYFRLWKFGFDCYILKYEGNQVLPSHRDPIEKGKHWRLNIGYGVSNFVCEKLSFGRRVGKLTIFIFRPDLYEHSLYVFEKTTKLSLGFAKYN